MKAVLVLVSILVCLLVAEVALWALGLPVAEVSGWRRVPTFERNEIGFRGRPIEYDEQTRVVVLLGDSQVEALASPFEWMPERLLEDSLRAQIQAPVRVVSLAASGYGQDQQLLVLAEYFERYRADLVLLWQTPENDIWNNTFPTHLPVNGAPKPTFWIEQGELRGPSEAMGAVIRRSPFRVGELALRALSSEGRDDVWEQRLPPAYVAATSYEGEASQVWQRTFDAGHWNQDLGREKSAQALRLVPPSPRTRYAIDLTHRLLMRIRDLASANHSGFEIFRVEKRDRQQASMGREQVVELNGLFYRVSEAQFERGLEATTAGLPVHRIPITVDDSRVSATDAHLNDRANAQAMADLSRLIASRLSAP